MSRLTCGKFTMEFERNLTSKCNSFEKQNSSQLGKNLSQKGSQLGTNLSQKGIHFSQKGIPATKFIANQDKFVNLQHNTYNRDRLTGCCKTSPKRARVLHQKAITSQNMTRIFICILALITTVEGVFTAVEDISNGADCKKGSQEDTLLGASHKIGKLKHEIKVNKRIYSSFHYRDFFVSSDIEFMYTEAKMAPSMHDSKLKIINQFPQRIIRRIFCPRSTRRKKYKLYSNGLFEIRQTYLYTLILNVNIHLMTFSCFKADDDNKINFIRIVFNDLSYSAKDETSFRDYDHIATEDDTNLVEHKWLGKALWAALIATFLTLFSKIKTVYCEETQENLNASQDAQFAHSVNEQISNLGINSNVISEPINRTFRTKQIKCVQLNMGKRAKALDELIIRATKNEVDIAMLQEPKIFNKAVANILGTVCFQHSSANPRAAIWISNKLVNKCQATLLNQFSDRDIATVLLKFVDENKFETSVLFSSIYLPCEENKKKINDPITSKFAHLVEFSERENIELIIGMDSNSHSHAWDQRPNRSEEDRRGKNLKNFLEGRLKIMNNGLDPTFEGGRGASIIDLTIASHDISSCISNWKVDIDNDSMSDHNYILFDLELPEVPPEEIRAKKRTNWKKYNEELQRRLNYLPFSNDSMNPSEMEKITSDLNNVLITTYEKNCKTKVIATNFKNRWYNENIDKERKLLKAKFNAIRQTSDSPRKKFLIQAYKKQRNLYRKLCSKTKSDSWKRTATSLEKLKDIARIQRMFENSRRHQIGSLKIGNGKYSKNREELIEALMKTHFPECTTLSTDNLPQTVPIVTNDSSDIELINEIVTETKVNDVLNNFGGFKAPSSDGIFPALLQKAPKSMIHILVNIFKSSLKCAYIPDLWKSVIVTFIPKQGKESYDEAKSFRPISLMSFLLKTLEKLIDNKIREKGFLKTPIHKSQHAYRKGKSTESALHDLLTIIEKNNKGKMMTLVAFLDISGAFDNTSFEAISKAAEKKGINKFIINWMESMLKNRSVTASIKGGSIAYNPTRGCPQGGCLSPTMWSLVLDDLLEKLEKDTKIKVIAFADDLAIVRTGEITAQKDLVKEINKSLNLIKKWCENKGLKVHPDKAAAMRFFSKPKIEVMNNVKYDGSPLKLVDEFKYLGVILDTKLSWKNHLENIKIKASNSLWASRSMIDRNWGLSPKSALWIYNQIILPRITYGSIVWWQGCQAGEGRELLNSVQYNALMLATGAVRTTSKHALNAILNYSPLPDQIKYNAFGSYRRLIENNSWKKGEIHRQYRGHFEIAKLYEDFMRESSDFTQDECNQTRVERKFFLNTSGSDNLMRNLKDFNDIWYCDGAFKDNKSAIGYTNHSNSVRRSKRISDHSGSSIAEAVALENCAREVANSFPENKRIAFICDDKTLVCSLKNDLQYKNSKIKIFETINEIAEENYVEIFWYPKKKALKGSTIAHIEATKGLEKTDTDIRTCIPEAKFDSLMKKRINDENIKMWSTEKSKLKHAGFFIKEYNEKVAKIITNLNKKETRVIIGILTGRGCLNGFLSKFKENKCSTCRHCKKEYENIPHVILKCERWSTERRLFLGIDENWTDSLDLLSINKLLRFSKATFLFESFFKLDNNHI